MHVITYLNKPATLLKIINCEQKSTAKYKMEELDAYIAAPTAKRAKDLFLYHFGFTWKERCAGIDVKKVL